MKTITFLKITLLFSFVAIAVSACSKKDKEEEPQYDSYYYLSYIGSEDKTNSANLNWDSENEYSNLYLEFDRGIPEGSDWYLECDKSWVELTNTHGRVASGGEDLISVKIGDNTSYEDREAHINLDVPEGIPSSTYQTTVTIHQYGYESHLKRGKTVSFTTNRSKAKSSKLTIGYMKIREMVEIIWGDGNSNIITKKDKKYQTNNGYEISHDYSSSGSFKVKIRFAPEVYANSLYFHCQIGNDEGIEEVETDSHLISFNNDSKKVSITYSQDNGFDVHQY